MGGVDVDTDRELAERRAWIAAPIEPRLSASTTEAPPCSRPYGCWLPSTGMVATIRSAEISRISMPIFSFSAPMGIAFRNSSTDT